MSTKKLLDGRVILKPLRAFSVMQLERLEQFLSTVIEDRQHRIKQTKKPFYSPYEQTYQVAYKELLPSDFTDDDVMWVLHDLEQLYSYLEKPTVDRSLGVYGVSETGPGMFTMDKDRSITVPCNLQYYEALLKWVSKCLVQKRNALTDQVLVDFSPVSGLKLRDNPNVRCLLRGNRLLLVEKLINASDGVSASELQAELTKDQNTRGFYVKEAVRAVNSRIKKELGVEDRFITSRNGKYYLNSERFDITRN